MSKLWQIDDDALVQRFFDHDYQDRGVVKWQGFYLSDHTAALKKQARQEAVKHPAKTQQSLEEMSVILSDAYANGKRVSIQVNDRDLNGEFRPDLVGKVIGYKEDKIYLAGQTDVSILDMRHVERGIGM
ncbi:hypothetical protein [Secundilactobacillus silagei]|uniref:DNA-directed RNA polymerase beta subunit n=1 Tax=Secundilactobacillus silagei JCM 19001 TaxID=1302250 RepID=A0A1Z5IGC2_9LACO|nr:hypothetical protein [Secundilactobacillus silagei]TDG73375.1 hypothetical protein C5L25_000524 [Secundilactobacillus silagei JCM 19001]GAX00746.1 hypothetical protein IWT126_00761 [Secundilactobacillus silagei JCM 19001]